MYKQTPPTSIAYSIPANKKELITRTNQRTIIPDVNYPFKSAVLVTPTNNYIANSIIANNKNVISIDNRFTSIPSQTSFKSFVRPKIIYDVVSLTSYDNKPNSKTFG